MDGGGGPRAGCRVCVCVTAIVRLVSGATGTASRCLWMMMRGWGWWCVSARSRFAAWLFVSRRGWFPQTPPRGGVRSSDGSGGGGAVLPRGRPGGRGGRGPVPGLPVPPAPPPQGAPQAHRRRALPRPPDALPASAGGVTPPPPRPPWRSMGGARTSVARCGGLSEPHALPLPHPLHFRKTTAGCRPRPRPGDPGALTSRTREGPGGGRGAPPGAMPASTPGRPG